MGDCVLGQGKRRARSQGPWLFEQSSSLRMVLAICNKRRALWNDVIKAKYGEEEGGWCSREVREGFRVGMWKETCSWWPLSYARSSFVIGNGRGVKFWRDY